MTTDTYSVRIVNTRFLKNGESFLDSVFNVIVKAESKQKARNLVKETYTRPEYIVGSAWKKS